MSTGADDDQALVEGVVAFMNEKGITAYNPLSLGGLGALFSRSGVVIGNDTGPIHLAAVVGASTVPTIWYPNLLNSSQFTRTNHRPVVSWQVHCPECGTNTSRILANTRYLLYRISKRTRYLRMLWS